MGVSGEERTRGTKAWNSSPELVFIALAFALGTGFAVVLAWATDFLACENAGTLACDRADLAELQFIVALGGLLPVALMLLAAFRGSRAQLIAAMVLTFVVYAVWAVLNDAAVHGWGSEMRLVP